MSTRPAQLALLGFTAFERSAIAAFVKLAGEQGPGYEVTDDLAQADCAVADADDASATRKLRRAGLLRRSVLLGTTPHHDAALQLPRPINLQLVTRALDTLVGARPRTGTRLATSPDDPPASAPSSALSSAQPRSAPASRPESGPASRPTSGPSAPAAFPHSASPSDSPSSSPSSHPSVAPRTSPAARALTGGTAPPTAAEPARSPAGDHVQRVLDELAFRTAPLPSNLDARAMAAEAALGTGRRGGSQRPASASQRSLHGPGPLPMEHILVVDQDAATLRMVAVQLQRFGFQMHLAGHPDDVLRLMATRYHDYIFMDPALPGLDALMVCRLARQIPTPEGCTPTTVVLLADPLASPTPLERALPAADACLKKPLEQHALLKLMGEREVARVAYADTARTTVI